MADLTNISQADTVADIASPNDCGSICCAVQSRRNPNFLGIVTAAHVFTKGDFLTDNNTFLDPSLQSRVTFNGIPRGKWLYKQLLDNQDLIVAQLDDGITSGSLANLLRFDDAYYAVTDGDVGKTQVTIRARAREYTAYILDHCVQQYPIRYGNGTFEKNNLILVGSTPDKADAKPVSQPGDSGACVYIEANGRKQLVGLLLGSDVNYTFVLPVRDTLSPNFKIV